ncbi:hypothetical protein CDAR_6711 [Caerostris darwini]|uniref:Uncharacterized protein n=1 Tax=Caerostris darwini TaxID=1538125 RepID=A0AAV4TB29_9ARAC|nr:hypothetical protein CDAR_6711 [Caerostris darwini]
MIYHSVTAKVLSTAKSIEDGTASCVIFHNQNRNVHDPLLRDNKSLPATLPLWAGRALYSLPNRRSRRPHDLSRALAATQPGALKRVGIGEDEPMKEPREPMKMDTPESKTHYTPEDPGF